MTEPSEPHCCANHGPSLSVIEAPLDPANQSLADALRLSFRVLKFVMIALVIIFLFSGVVMVDEKQVVVLTRFGKQVGAPLKPGLHIALPYPIDEQVPVSTAQKRLSIDTFWLRITAQDQARDLSQLEPRGKDLDPATDGALLTGDRAIMHLLFTAEYRITSATDYVMNVEDAKREKELLQVVLRNAAVAETARATADLVWKDASTLASRIKSRAQKRLDLLESGIVLDDVIADKSYFPLQTKRQFLMVSNAENRKRELVNEADSERTKKLLGVAGPACVARTCPSTSRMATCVWLSRSRTATYECHRPSSTVTPESRSTSSSPPAVVRKTSSPASWPSWPAFQTPSQKFDSVGPDSCVRIGPPSA